MKTLTFAALAIVVGCLSMPAQAMTWTLVDVTFAGGGAATGSFFYDAGSNTYSDIALSTTGGSGFSGTDYTAFQAGNESTLQVVNGLSVLQLSFVSPLTDLGGTIALGTSREGRDPFEGICSVSVPCRDYSEIRSIISGSVTTDAQQLAEPGSLLLFLIGLVGVARFSRRTAN
jgi:hypothetical protein